MVKKYLFSNSHQKKDGPSNEDVDILINKICRNNRALFQKKPMFKNLPLAELYEPSDVTLFSRRLLYSNRF